MQIWVDIDSGTWGNAERLRLLDGDKLGDFAEWDDDDRASYATHHGQPIMTSIEDRLVDLETIKKGLEQ